MKYGICASLPIFSFCKDRFDPTKHWLDGLSPAHPLFKNAERVDQIVQTIKTDLYDAILAGCRILLKRYSDTSVSALTLQKIIDGDLAVWKAIISVHKYGVNYLANRAEARSFHQIYLARETAAGQIEQFYTTQWDLLSGSQLCRAPLYH